MANVLKNNIAKGYIQPDIKINYKATVIKTVKCWHENRKIYVKQFQKYSPHLCNHLIYDKGDTTVP